MGMDGHAFHRIAGIRGVDPRISRLLGRLLRWEALRPQGGLVGDGRGAGAPELPELVSGTLSLRLRQVPLRVDHLIPIWRVACALEGDGSSSANPPATREYGKM